MNRFKNKYNSLGTGTRLIIRIWLLTTLWAVILAIIAQSADQYHLLLLSDDLAVAARSTGVIGGICTIIAVRWEKRT
ncbi:MAG: hypothetical protein J6Q83_06730 [Clostridia bacterium]|nr:hypothetical protein [Clostridia bacterium]